MKEYQLSASVILDHIQAHNTPICRVRGRFRSGRTADDAGGSGSESCHIEWAEKEISATISGRVGQAYEHNAPRRPVKERWPISTKGLPDPIILTILQDWRQDRS